MDYYNDPLLFVLVQEIWWSAGALHSRNILVPRSCLGVLVPSSSFTHRTIRNKITVAMSYPQLCVFLESSDQGGSLINALSRRLLRMLYNPHFVTLYMATLAMNSCIIHFPMKLYTVKQRVKRRSSNRMSAPQPLAAVLPRWIRYLSTCVHTQTVAKIQRNGRLLESTCTSWFRNP